MQARMLLRAELRPEKWVFPNWGEPILIQPDGTVIYDEFCVTEAYAKRAVDEWITRVSRGRMMIS